MAACGTTTAVSASLTGTTLSKMPNPFEQAVHALPGAPSASVETIVVELDGESWVVPAAVCLRADSDSDIVLAEAERQVAIVHSLVAPMISGWPSTTRNPSWTEEARATWEQDLRIAGVTTMTLAGLVGEQPALKQSWVEYEHSFADPKQGWGSPTHISSRVAGCEVEAQALTQAIAAQCPET